MTHPASLLRYLDQRLISVQSELSSRKKLLQEMARLLALPLQDKVQDDPELNIEREVYQSLLEREKLGNTGIGNGVAMPHSRFDYTDDAVIAIITLSDPIDYDSLDRQPVDVAFGLIVPKQATDEHLRILADIARTMSVEGNKQLLASAKTAQQALELIEGWSDPETG